jgi:hypothetical protein
MASVNHNVVRDCSMYGVITFYGLSFALRWAARQLQVCIDAGEVRVQASAIVGSGRST